LAPDARSDSSAEKLMAASANARGRRRIGSARPGHYNVSGDDWTAILGICFNPGIIAIRGRESGPAG
jgi:hypothetical protein